MIITATLILFFGGLLAISWNSHNFLRILVGAELGLLAANYLFISSALTFQPIALAITFFVLAIAAVEVAIGLGLVMLTYFRFGTIQLLVLSNLQG